MEATTLHDYEDQKPLLESTALNSSQRNGSATPAALQLRYVSFRLEPLAIMYVMASFASMPLMGQYIYSRVLHQHLEDFGNTSDVNVSQVNARLCDLDTKSDAYELRIKVQSSATNWGLVLELVVGLASFPSTLILGAYSDRWGRKIPLMLPILGDLSNLIVQMSVIHFHLPLYWLMAGNCLAGLGSSLLGFIAGCYAFVSNTTSTEKRSLRIAFLQLTLETAVGISSLVAGLGIQYGGFLRPAFVMAGLHVAALCYLIFAIPNIRPQNSANLEKNRGACFGYIRRSCAVFLRRGRRARLWLLLLAFTAAAISVLGRGNTDSLFEMDEPFCWGPLHMGWFGATLSISSYLCSALIVLFFGRLLSDTGLAFLGCVSAIASLLTWSFARTDAALYSVIGVGIAAGLPMPMIRSAISKIVDVDEQGGAFAVLGVAHIICSSSGTVLLGAVYTATVAWHRGAIYWLQAVLFLLAIFFLGIYRRTDFRFKKDRK